MKVVITIYDLYHMASDILLNKNEKYQHIIDEAQDLGPHMLRFVRSLTKKKMMTSLYVEIRGGIIL